MKAKIMMMISALTVCAMPMHATLKDGLEMLFMPKEEPQATTIKVLIAHDQPGVILETKGRYRVVDPNTEKVLATRYAGKRKFIQPMREGLRWGESFPGCHQLKFVPETPQGTINVEGVEYKGSIYVYSINGIINVVNEVDIEDYVASILTIKFKENLAPEGMAAIAIAERTNALYEAENPKTVYWAVDAEQVGYQGHAITSYANRVDRAVQLTRNMVMSRTAAYEGVITPFPAYWHNMAKESKAKGQTVISKVSLQDVQTMADSGDHAAQILNRAFPDSSIQLIH